MYRAIRPPRGTPRASRPFATRFARRWSSPTVVFRGGGEAPVADTIATWRGGPLVGVAARHGEITEVPVDREVPPPAGVAEEQTPQLDPQAHLLGGVRPP